MQTREPTHRPALHQHSSKPNSKYYKQRILRFACHGRLAQDERTERTHFAAAIEVTLIMSPLSVPVTLTFSPAKARGLVWSLSL